MIKKLAQSFRSAVLSLCMLGGFATSSWAMNETYNFYQLGESEEHSPTNVKLNTVAPEFKNLTDFWIVKRSEQEKVYKIVGFPGESQTINSTPSARECKDYLPEFTGTCDSLILSLSDKPDFLDYPWTSRGLSCHGILAKDGILVIYADPLEKKKGKMAGKWNERALGIVCIHSEGDKKISEQQKDSLKKHLGVLHEKSTRVKIVYGGSIWQAKQIEGFGESSYVDGKVENIESVVNNLGLLPLGDFFKTTDDILTKK